jgi:hypothetical protein
MYQEQQEQPKAEYKGEVDSEVIRAIITQQSQKLHLEEKKFLLEEKNLEYNTRLAEQAMKFNSVFLKDAPKNGRKLLATQAMAASLILLIILSFIGYCLYIGKEEVVNKLIVFFTHSVTLILGLFIGRNIKKRDKNDDRNEDMPQAEIVQ